MGLAAVSLPYYRHIAPYGLHKFARFATEVWGVFAEGRSQEELAEAGIDALEAFCRECGIGTSLRDLGTTEDMLPKIAESSIILEGGYRKLTSGEILEILKQCF